MRFKKKESKRLSLDVTPLIDVIFLLLIFFMVSTTFITSPGIHVNLPEASVKVKTDKPKSLEIVITQKQEIFLNGRKLKRKTLARQLATAKKKSGFEHLIIRADGKTRHETVVFVMDVAKKVGLHKLSIATKPKPSP